MLRTAVALCLTALATAVSFQQVPRAITLRSADATLGEPFTSIYSIRELADGRVLVTDNSSETRIVVADLRRNLVRTVGHQGAGPGEYRLAGRLVALTHDSTLFIDAAQGRRWLILTGDSIVRTLPPDDPAVSSAGDVFGADTAGRVLGLGLNGADRLSGDFSRLYNAAILTSPTAPPPPVAVTNRGNRM